MVVNETSNVASGWCVAQRAGTACCVTGGQGRVVVESGAAVGQDGAHGSSEKKLKKLLFSILKILVLNKISSLESICRHLIET